MGVQLYCYKDNINFMKKIYILAFVLFVIVMVFVFFNGKGNTVEAPTVGDLPVGLEEMPLPVEEEVVTEPVMKDGVKEFAISGSNFSFVPNVISVKKGDKVRIIFQNTAGFHDFKIDEYGVASKKAQAPSQEILEFTADKTGTFEYYCSVGSHRTMGMVGTLKVE